ncbi:MAG: DUF2520 domain-containing protein [Actinomycetota bacterium]|nr:DUF2520 domain-containing protein [Actinomycetota bacterium]
MDNRVAIIGAGRAGISIGLALQKKGFRIVSASARAKDSLERAARLFPKALVTGDMAEAARLGKIIIIATPDGQIEEVCNYIAQNGGFESAKLVMHLSGATPLKVLDAARRAGAEVCSLHPTRSFADAAEPIVDFSGTYFGVTASSKEGQEFLMRVVAALGGLPVIVADQDKPLYHAAACIVSNYLVCLIDLAKETYELAGLSESDSQMIFWPLLEGTLANIKKMGPIAALTGPIARGDIDTLKGHLKALRAKGPKSAFLYGALGRRTAAIALKKGSITDDKANEMVKLFEKELS